MAVLAAAGLEGRLAFTISVPETWYELELEPATRQARNRHLVETRVRGNQAMWDQRRAIEKVLEEQARAAHEAGAVYCAAFSMPTPEGAVTGSVTVSLVHDPAADIDGAGLGPTFAENPRGEDPLEPFQVTSIAELPGQGGCPRSAGIDDAPLGEGHFVRHVFMVTAVPLPDLDRVFLVTASSPVVPLVDALLDLFDAVTGTFRVVRLDEGDDR